MKMFRLTIDMPWRYGENSKGQQAADMQMLADTLCDVGLGHLQVSDKSGAQEIITTAEQCAMIMVKLPNTRGMPKVEKVVELGDFGGDGHDQLLGILARIEASAAVLEARADLGSDFHGDLYNPHANAPIPNNILSGFNDLMLCENSCTDAVQEHLNEGWRIVAVCPQASRRPDYVLGRYNIGNERPGAARRG